MQKLEKFECSTCGCYFMVNDRDSFNCPNCDKKKFIAIAPEMTGRPVTDTVVNFEAASIEDARHWIINHLDMSYEWIVTEACNA